ncbi:MAG: hypothetical protein JWN14_4422, partial [Chthonomonadales bacterium]|nr:hypothetical protein [Chthonomonadales bacterium]
MGFGEVGGKEVDRRLNVFDVRHLVDGVDVAGRDGEGEGGHTASAALDAAGVGAAAGQDLQLVFDAFGFCNVSEVADQFRVAEERRVYDLDRGAVAELGHLILVGNAGQIDSKRYVEGDADVGLEGVGGGSRTPQADLFLGRGDRENAGFRGCTFEFAERFDQDEDAQAVVQCLADHHIPDLLGGAVHRDHVALFDKGFDLVTRHAEIYEEVIHLRRFVAFISGQEVG